MPTRTARTFSAEIGQKREIVAHVLEWGRQYLRVIESQIEEVAFAHGLTLPALCEFISVTRKRE